MAVVASSTMIGCFEMSCTRRYTAAGAAEDDCCAGHTGYLAT